MTVAVAVADFVTVAVADRVMILGGAVMVLGGMVTRTYTVGPGVGLGVATAVLVTTIGEGVTVTGATGPERTAFAICAV